MPILTYHSLDDSGSIVSVHPKVFAEQMACLAKHGIRAMNLREAVSYREKTGDWQSNSVVLTFDDGFENFYEHAFPILMQYRFTATVFLISDYVGKQNYWDAPLPKLGKRSLMSWNQAREISANGIEIGAHSRTHKDLCHSHQTEVEREMFDSKSEIEQRIENRVESFAYPYGSFNRSVSEIALRHFKAACTTELKIAGEEPFNTLPRVDMFYIDNSQMFEKLVNRKLDSYLTIRRWGRAVRSAFGN